MSLEEALAKNTAAIEELAKLIHKVAGAQGLDPSAANEVGFAPAPKTAAPVSAAKTPKNAKGKKTLDLPEEPAGPVEEAPPTEQTGLLAPPAGALVAAVKEALGEVRTRFGAEEAKKILAWVGAQRMSEVANTIAAYGDILEKAKARLKDQGTPSVEDEAPPVEGPKPEAKSAATEVSVEAMRASVVAVANSPALGRDTMIKIMKDVTGFDKLALVKPEQYADLKNAADKALAAAGAV